MQHKNIYQKDKNTSLQVKTKNHLYFKSGGYPAIALLCILNALGQTYSLLSDSTPE